MLISYIWSSNHFSISSCFPCFSGSRFFRIQVFQGPGFSGSRVGVQGPGSESRVRVQSPGPGSGSRVQGLGPGSRVRVKGPGSGFRSSHVFVLYLRKASLNKYIWYKNILMECGEPFYKKVACT